MLAVCFALPAMASSVAQGKCVSYDDGKKELVIDEYDIKFTPEHKYGSPTGKQGSYDCSNAMMGITPKPGDIVRIAYDQKDSKNMAIRVMNVTKTDIMKK
jgi:hypothetical protein